MATQTTTTAKNDGEVRLREKKVISSKQDVNVPISDMKSTSTFTTTSAPTEEKSCSETAALPKSQASTFEQAFFFGLTIDEALNSTENLLELFYNACKYNHLELIKRCVDEKHVNVNEPFNNDYPLCIAR